MKMLYCIEEYMHYKIFKGSQMSACNLLLHAELCALVNKPSGASAGASDLKY